MDSCLVFRLGSLFPKKTLILTTWPSSTLPPAPVGRMPLGARSSVSPRPVTCIILNLHFVRGKKSNETYDSITGQIRALSTPPLLAPPAPPQIQPCSATYMSTSINI